jgi:hypothetical protein
MERLGLVVNGLLHLISPKIIGVERGAKRQQPVYTGIVVNNFISLYFKNNLCEFLHVKTELNGLPNHHKWNSPTMQVKYWKLSKPRLRRFRFLC